MPGAAQGQDMDDILPLGEMGIRNFVTANQRGLGMQYARFTRAGAGDEAGTFGALLDPGGNALLDMADTAYGVLIENETAGTVITALAGTKTTTGFTIAATGAAGGAVCSIVVFGQIRGTPPPP